MSNTFHDDVIRIRVDTVRAVRDFLDLLTQQAAEGETRQPGKPRATAIYRELAPYRLVEYNYVDSGVGEVQGAYVGLPNGTIYSATDEIPEDAVDAMIGGEVDHLPPVYVYVVLDDPRPAGAIDPFLTALSHHVGLPFVGVFRGQGAMTARFYPGDDPVAAAQVDGDALVARALGETGKHLSKEQVLDRFAARSRSLDGRAFARIAYAFTRHVVSFSSVADRDDFVAWSRTLAGALNAAGGNWEDLGFTEIFRPAEPQPEPDFGQVVTAMIAPRQYQDGRPLQAFADGALVDAKQARDYWEYVTDTIDANEAGAARLDGWVVRA